MAPTGFRIAPCCDIKSPRTAKKRFSNARNLRSRGVIQSCVTTPMRSRNLFGRKAYRLLAFVVYVLGLAERFVGGCRRLWTAILTFEKDFTLPDQQSGFDNEGAGIDGTGLASSSIHPTCSVMASWLGYRGVYMSDRRPTILTPSPHSAHNPFRSGSLTPPPIASSHTLYQPHSAQAPLNMATAHAHPAIELSPAQATAVADSDIVDVEKSQTEHVELEEIDEKNQNKQKVDYSGFSQKTDPKEIKLVRKLDTYIMVGALALECLELH